LSLEVLGWYWVRVLKQCHSEWVPGYGSAKRL